MKKIQILFAAFEAVPFAKTGGLGDVAGSLPEAINSPEYDIRVFLPKHAVIPQKYVDEMEFVTKFDVQLSWRVQYCGILKLVKNGVTYYFIDNEYYFKRDEVYGYGDDGERVAFFSKAVLESVLHLPDFAPDVIHANDWHAALIPVFLRELYQGSEKLSRAKTVFSIHNLKFQGQYSDFVIGDVCGLHETPAAWQLKQDDGGVNFLKGAVIYSDVVSTVSPTYAEEICTDYFGEGLAWLFNERRDRLVGILNGIDNDIWNPETDPDCTIKFNVNSIEKKAENKLLLQKELGLKEDAGIPMFALISRLTEQKGLDLLLDNMQEICKKDIQLVILGIGDKVYEDSFSNFAKDYPEKIAVQLCFNTPLSHRMYAGADVLLMPSRFEPCGLSQMMAMRYGTLPLVRRTGGLKDSVNPLKENPDNATGFAFDNFVSSELLSAISFAENVWYNEPEKWAAVRKNAMEADFSWKSSAEKYCEMYKKLLTP